MRRYIRNERGSVVPFTVCFVLALVILLVMTIIYISSEIIFINVRNAVKSEMANISMRISDETYSAMREGDLDAYLRKLIGDASYRASLEQLAISGIESVIPLATQNYRIESIQLGFKKDSDSIEYKISCDVVYCTEFWGESVCIT